MCALDTHPKEEKWVHQQCSDSVDKGPCICRLVLFLVSEDVHKLRYDLDIGTCYADWHETLVKHSVFINEKQVFDCATKSLFHSVIYVLQSNRY